MLSYHNDRKIKENILAQLQAHFSADEIIKGVYWENGKGCAIGCILHSNNHSEGEDRFGIPVAIFYLIDVLFEGLPNHLSKSFPLRVMSAISVGVDLSLVTYQFLHWLLVDPIGGVLRFVKTNSFEYRAINQVATLYQDVLNGFLVSHEQWLAATGPFVYTSATCAASVARARYAASVARYDSYASAACARYTASAAHHVSDAAKDTQYQLMADKLIEILQSTETSVGEGRK